MSLGGVFFVDDDDVCVCLFWHGGVVSYGPFIFLIRLDSDWTR